MKFAVVLDKVCSSIVPSDTSEGFTWKQAVQEVIEYCKEADYLLQEEFFEVVYENKDAYLSGNFPIVLV